MTHTYKRGDLVRVRVLYSTHLYGGKVGIVINPSHVIDTLDTVVVYIESHILYLLDSEMELIGEA